MSSDVLRPEAYRPAMTADWQLIPPPFPILPFDPSVDVVDVEARGVVRRRWACSFAMETATYIARCIAYACDFDVYRHALKCPDNVSEVKPDHYAYLVGTDAASRGNLISYARALVGGDVPHAVARMYTELATSGVQQAFRDALGEVVRDPAFSASGSAERVMQLQRQPNLAWHLVLVQGERDIPAVDGKCYLSVFKSHKRELVHSRLGPWPTFSAIMNMDRSYFVSDKRLSQLVVTADDPTRPAPDSVSMVVTDAFTEVARVWPAGLPVNVGSMMARYGGHSLSAPSPGFFPGPMDIVGGRTWVPRSGVEVTTTRRAKHVFPLSEGVCDSAWSRAVVEWSGQSDCDESGYLDAITEVLAPISPSSLARRPVFFQVNDVWLSTDVLVRHVSSVVPAGNAMNLWVRCFRSGQLCMRIRGMLSCSENRSLRQVALSRYRAPDQAAGLCFDTVRVLRHIGMGFTYPQRVFIRMARSVKFGNAEFPDICHLSSRDIGCDVT